MFVYEIRSVIRGVTDRIVQVSYRGRSNHRLFKGYAPEVAGFFNAVMTGLQKLTCTLLGNYLECARLL